MGAVQNVHEKISDAMIFVLTSESEGLSNALIEALLIGIPSISSDWNGVEDLIIDGENGLLFKRGSSEELADKMLFLSNNPDIRKKLSKNGYLMREKFAFKNIFPLYRKAIEGEIENL